ncbi:hypothetical protein AQ475_10710 [Burkholderia thailandensis]|nr:hypothetical protein AQ475_10710 [Burkholderia thailandensis]
MHSIPDQSCPVVMVGSQHCVLKRRKQSTRADTEAFRQIRPIPLSQLREDDPLRGKITRQAYAVRVIVIAINHCDRSVRQSPITSQLTNEGNDIRRANSTDSDAADKLGGVRRRCENFPQPHRSLAVFNEYMCIGMDLIVKSAHRKLRRNAVQDTQPLRPGQQ